MKKTISLVLLGIAMTFTLTGCRTQLKEVTAVVQDEAIDTNEALVDISNLEEDSIVMDKINLKKFFEKYFSLSLEDRLLLNQDSMSLDEEQRKSYQERLDEFKLQLAPFLGEEGLMRLEKGYVREKFHLPKLLEINHYVSEETSQVEDVEIVSARPLGNRIIYQVDITTKEKVIDIIEANTRYVWDASTQYYTYREEADSREIAFKSGYNLQDSLENSYLFLQLSGESEDEVRLVHSYWIEVTPDQELQIESIQEADRYTASEVGRQAANYNKHVTRQAYQEEASKEHKEIIQQIFINIFERPKEFYSYYEKAWQQEFEKFEETLLDDLGLKKWIALTPIGYKDAFHPHINPYKDNIERITIQKEGVSIIPSLYSTQKQPRYQVKIPAKVLKNNNEERLYTYEYLIGFEENKVEFIQFIGIKE